jgi:hypothetical protein
MRRCRLGRPLSRNASISGDSARKRSVTRRDWVGDQSRAGNHHGAPQKQIYCVGRLTMFAARTQSCAPVARRRSICIWKAGRRCLSKLIVVPAISSTSKNYILISLAAIMFPGSCMYRDTLSKPYSSKNGNKSRVTCSIKLVGAAPLK